MTGWVRHPFGHFRRFYRPDMAASLSFLRLAVITAHPGRRQGLLCHGRRWNIFHKVGISIRKGSCDRTGYSGCLAGVLCLSGTYGQLLDYVVFAVLIFYVLTIFGLFRLRKNVPMLIAVPGFWLSGYSTGIIFLAILVMVILLIYKPGYTWPG